MPSQKKAANVVGPQVQRLRYELELTQEQFAARCQVAGLDISRSTLAQIEAQLRCVTDKELFLLSRVLAVSTEHLFPAEMRRKKRLK